MDCWLICIEFKYEIIVVEPVSGAGEGFDLRPVSDLRESLQ